MKSKLACRPRSTSCGYTFIELIIATAVMMVLASAALPLARVSMRRQKEVELRRDLREMRLAIDKFKDAQQQMSVTEQKFSCEGYPASLDVLVEGVTRANDASGRKLKFLRRVPIDPLTGKADWGLRDLGDAVDSNVWAGNCVWDVYSKAEGKGLDGSKYRDW